MNVNDNNCNFNVRNVDEGNLNNTNMYNSDGNDNNNLAGLFPVASITLWLCNHELYKGRIETNHVLSH